MHSIEFFSLELLMESSKYPAKLRENSGNLISQKCGHPETFHLFPTQVYLSISSFSRFDIGGHLVLTIASDRDRQGGE